MSFVYLDNAASTRPADEVVRVMAEVALQDFANPASAHEAGAASARRLEQARQELAAVLGVAVAELTFTSGGTEANALAVLGVAARARGRHLVVSAIEHPAVLGNAERLAREGGFEISVVSPDRSGVVRPADITAAMRPDTVLVAVMLVNNELGTIQPVADIARALAAARPSDNHGQRAHFHVDAVQAFGTLPLRPGMLGADSLALSAHKIHGPKGVGALWIRPKARVAPLWQGGGQEGGLRSGSENLPGVVGFARAAAMAQRALASGAARRVMALRDQLEECVLQSVPGARRTVSVDAEGRAPHISSLSLPGLPAEPLLHALGARGVMVSAGSACASRSRGPSHVLKAIGLLEDDSAVLRFSLSRDTTATEIDTAARAVAEAVAEIAGSVTVRGASRGNRGAGKPDRI